jgi:hypothetical protein
MQTSLRHPSRVALVSLTTLLLAACADEEKTKQAVPQTQDPPAPDPRRAALDQAIGSDPGLTQPPVRTMLLAACMHPQAGKAIMDSAGTTASGLLKTFVQPWLRPLFMDAADQAIQDRSRALKALRSGSAQPFHYNVVIVGAGPNGVLAAYHLKQANPALKVALLDGEELPGQVFRSGRLRQHSGGIRRGLRPARDVRAGGGQAPAGNPAGPRNRRARRTRQRALGEPEAPTDFTVQVEYQGPGATAGQVRA